MQYILNKNLHQIVLRMTLCCQSQVEWQYCKKKKKAEVFAAAVQRI